MMTAMLMLFSASACMAVIVLADMAVRELQNPRTYRGTWICYRNRLIDLLKFMGVRIERRCALANRIMRLCRLPDPTWP